jgi:hypothetical protein
MTTFNSTTPVWTSDTYTLHYAILIKWLLFDKYKFDIVHIIHMNTCKDAISIIDAPVMYGNKILQSDDGVMHVYVNN